MESKSDYAPLKASRKLQDSKLRYLHRTHEILEDSSMTDDEKVICLITEQKFGRHRAQELVYGKIRYNIASHKESKRSINKYTLIEED